LAGEKPKNLVLAVNYRVSTNLKDMDLDVIHGFITNAYWAKGRSRAVMEKAMNNSLCFGLFDGDQQIGFARMVTDRATYGYLADVFVVPGHRGRGASKILMNEVMAHPELQHLRKIMLTTSDAHGLYKQYGFAEIADASKLMEIADVDDYKIDSI
jgi:N-acetylglutamate synthase-like GNAT family acetyltransferase